MDFNQKDIEAVADARVNNAEKSKTNRWAWIMFIGIMVGFVLAYKVNLWIGALLCIVAIVLFLWYNNSLTKKKAQKRYIMVKQWVDENSNKGVK